MTYDYELQVTPELLQDLLRLNTERNHGGPCVLAIDHDTARQIEILELQSREPKPVTHAVFVRTFGAHTWEQRA